ncbi:hypothetical protein ACK3SF_02250 [Candidatus Nanosalina sp. VS9-1]|uniref:hypothetical protein n=1 Tax=Candidatus Nanosalina sp. VS9-1 TaxID=3388566 RepID=UPI0039DF6567
MYNQIGEAVKQYLDEDILGSVPAIYLLGYGLGLHLYPGNFSELEIIDTATQSLSAGLIVFVALFGILYLQKSAKNQIADKTELFTKVENIEQEATGEAIVNSLLLGSGLTLAHWII